MNSYLKQNYKPTYDNRVEQVDASVRFVLSNQPAYYESLKNLPSRVTAALLIMVMDNPESLSGYHYRILQKAARQFGYGSGFMASTEPPFSE